MVQEIAKRAYFSRSAKMAKIGSSRGFETASKQMIYVIIRVPRRT